jgi:hypothetical protein
MKTIYCVSDIHSTYTKFLQQMPKKFDKLIIAGDLFNKGTEQEEMFMWLYENYNNPKYVFIYGNHDVRFFNEIHRLFYPSRQLANKELANAWFKSDNNINITNVVRNLIVEKKVDYDIIMKKIMPIFKWYHIEHVNNKHFIISHASWQAYRTAKEQDKRNLVYDTNLVLNEVKTKSQILTKYISYCKRHGVYHIFGHFPCPKVFNVEAPYIYKEHLIYIDNAVFQRAQPYYFHRLE